MKIEEELSELRKENEELVKRWDGEKASIARVREVKKRSMPLNRKWKALSAAMI